jgi:general secretion pathway protein C
VALIAVDGKPPRAFRIGSVVDGQNVLKTVNARGATLGPRDGAALVALNLPPPPAAATGTLPPLPGAAPPALPYPGATQLPRPSVAIPPGAAGQRRGPPGGRETPDEQAQPGANPGQDQTLTR